MSESTNPLTEVATRLRDELKGKSTVEKLQILVLEVADEADAIKKARASGALEDPTVASQRRVVALKEMGNLIVNMEKVSTEVDLKHPVLKVLIDYIFEVVEKALTAHGMPRAQIDAIFTNLFNYFQDWETEVEARFKVKTRDQAFREDERRKQMHKEDKEAAKLAAVA